MLYCPKCNQNYEDGVQRFCTNDSVRLIPAPGSGGQPGGVFTSVLNRTTPSRERSKMFAEMPSLFNPEQKPATPIEVHTPDETETLDEIDLSSVITGSITESVSVISNQITKPEISLPTAKPAARLIKANEVPASQAELGDRAVNPSGREALTWENPDVLIGQTVKGRYVITEKLGEDETGFIYLAEDKISDGKKVVVRVLMEENADDLSSRILAEERVSLSHVNHPNVAHLFDSGELHEGFPFIITEYIDGESLKEKFDSAEQFNLQRTAKIIRQAANALSEAHRSGILHRNLKPKNIILGMTEAGAEQVKVNDFGVFDGFETQTEENLAYLSPEQLQENYPTAASDIYSLAVIAFQLLTGRLPFEFSTLKELSKAQKEDLSLLPANLRLAAPPEVDEVLQKALAYDPEKRYPKARDFGDAFYNALAARTPSAEKGEDEKHIVEKEKSAQLNALPIPKPFKNLTADKDQAIVEESPAEQTKPVPLVAEDEAKSLVKPETENIKTPNGLAWEKRSPEPIKPLNGWRIGAIVLILLILFVAVWGIWNYYLHRPEQSVYAPPKAGTANQNTAEPSTVDTGEDVAPTAEIDAPPPPRAINQPLNTTFFENSKADLKGDLAKNFRGFSFYYPKDWVRNPSQTNFVDVARVGATGTPIEQLLVSYYESKGTMAADSENFPKLVDKSNKDLSAMISDYQVVSKGATTINNWKVYEVKFQGSGKTVNGDKITLWGRRLWIPAARLDVKTGLLITMLATSNSPDVKSAEDVGLKGELAGVLETFEPAPLDTGY